MNTHRIPRVKTFKRRRRLSNDPQLSTEGEKSTRPNESTNIVEPLPSPPQRRNSTKEYLEQMNEMTGVLGLDDKKENNTAPSSSNTPPLSIQLSASKITTKVAEYNSKKEWITFWIILLCLIVCIIYLINSQQLIAAVSTTFNLQATISVLGEQMSNGVWMAKSWVEQCKQNGAILLHSLLHWIHHYRSMIERQLDKEIVDATNMILDYRHQLANWIDPYPR